METIIELPTSITIYHSLCLLNLVSYHTYPPYSASFIAMQLAPYATLLSFFSFHSILNINSMPYSTMVCFFASPYLSHYVVIVIVVCFLRVPSGYKPMRVHLIKNQASLRFSLKNSLILSRFPWNLDQAKDVSRQKYLLLGRKGFHI